MLGLTLALYQVAAKREAWHTIEKSIEQAPHLVLLRTTLSGVRWRTLRVDSDHIPELHREDRLSSRIRNLNPVAQSSVAVTNIVSHFVARVPNCGCLGSLQVWKLKAFLIDQIYVIMQMKEVSRHITNSLPWQGVPDLRRS